MLENWADDELNVDIYVPRFSWDKELEQYNREGVETVITRDREDPDVLIFDVGGDVGELYFRVADIVRAARYLGDN